MNKLKTVLKSITEIKDPISLILDIFHLMRKDYILVFKNGMKFHIRHGSKNIVSDSEIIDEVIMNDQYKITNSTVNYQNVVDIGAQVGTFAINFVYNHPNSKVIAYEPNPNNYMQLEKNISLNKLDRNIKALNLAITNKKGIAKLFSNPINVGGHSIFQTGNNQSNKVSSIRLEDIFKMNKLKNIDLLKMDCEGGEYKIFLSASKGTLQKISTIAFELHETPETIKKYSAKILLDFLVKNDFEYKIIKEIYHEDEGRFWIVIAKQKQI